MFIDRALKLRSTDRLPRDCFISPSVSFPSPSTTLLPPLSLLHSPLNQMILILSCGEFHIRTAPEYFCVCRQAAQTVGRACRLPHQSYETEEWEQSETMNESGREGGETRNRRAERQHYRENHPWKDRNVWSDWFCDPFIRDEFSSMCCIFFFMFSRAGLNLLEEKARKKMSNHGFNSLSAAQVGPSAVLSWFIHTHWQPLPAACVRFFFFPGYFN